MIWKGNSVGLVLEKENVDKKACLWMISNYDTGVCGVSESGERTFAFARKPGADTRSEEELDIDILDQTYIFHVGSLSLTDSQRRYHFYAVKGAKNKGSIISS